MFCCDWNWSNRHRVSMSKASENCFSTPHLRMFTTHKHLNAMRESKKKNHCRTHRAHKQARQATAIHQVKKFKFECDQHTTKCTKKIPLFDSKYHHGANCLLILPSDSMFWIFRRFLSFPLLLLLLLVVLLQFFFFTCQCLHVLACLPFFSCHFIAYPIPCWAPSVSVSSSYSYSWCYCCCLAHILHQQRWLQNERWHSFRLRRTKTLLFRLNIYSSEIVVTRVDTNNTDWHTLWMGTDTVRRIRRAHTGTYIPSMQWHKCEKASMGKCVTWKA